MKAQDTMIEALRADYRDANGHEPSWRDLVLWLHDRAQQAESYAAKKADRVMELEARGPIPVIRP